MKAVAALSTDYIRKDGRVAIRIVVHLNGRKLKVPERSWYILPDEWSEETRQVKLKRPDGSRVQGDDDLSAGDINASINTTINDVTTFYTSHPETSLELLVSAPLRASAERIRQRDSHDNKPAALLSFWDWIDDFIKRAQAGKLIVRKKAKRKGQPIAENTVKSYLGTINNLRLFHERRMRLNWDVIDKKLYEELLHFLRFELKTNESRVNHKPKNSETFYRPRRDNAVGKDIKNFRALIGWAMEDLEGEEYRGKFPEITAHRKSWFMVPEEDISKYVPEPEERDAIFAVKLDDYPHLIKHQDRAIVAYYFLQRFGDSMDFDRGNFYTSGNRHYLRYTSEKTSTPVEIPIKPDLWKILKRNNYTMPKMTNEEANRALKQIGQLAVEDCPGLNGWHIEYATIGGKKQKVRKRKYDCLTTHTFRRLGATDMDEAGVMTAIIMALGGWATEEQMRDYIAKGGRRARAQARIAAQHEFFQ